MLAINDSPVQETQSGSAIKRAYGEADGRRHHQEGLVLRLRHYVHRPGPDQMLVCNKCPGSIEGKG
jgi:hypothetical protein